MAHCHNHSFTVNGPYLATIKFTMNHHCQPSFTIMSIINHYNPILIPIKSCLSHNIQLIMDKSPIIVSCPIISFPHLANIKPPFLQWLIHQPISRIASTFGIESQMALVLLCLESPSHHWPCGMDIF